MTTPLQSGAPFVGERVFQNPRVLRASDSFCPLPHPLPSTFFALAPFFARPECEKLLRVTRISFASYAERLLYRLLLCRRSGLFCFALHMSFCVRRCCQKGVKYSIRSRKSVFFIIISFRSSPLREKNRRRKGIYDHCRNC